MTTSPLSPHLQIHKPVLTMIFSITHRISGIIFAISLPFLAFWIGSVYFAPSGFEVLSMFFNLPFVKLIFIFWFFALNHHLLNGLKYFLWTFAKGMELNQVYIISYSILLINLIMTAIFSWSIFS
jgi:succinate dehydrogenase / fumarate reductase cytochrome b subunit